MPTFLYRSILSPETSDVKEKIRKIRGREEIVGAALPPMGRRKKVTREKKIDINSENKKRIKKLCTISTEFSTISWRNSNEKRIFDPFASLNA